MINNVFVIPRPETIHCHVQEYHWGRGQLSIKLSRLNSPEIQYLRFQGVEVYAGPMQWDGGNFVQQPTSACLEIMQIAGRVPDFATEAMLQERNIKLYTVELAQMQVQIVCHTANKYTG
jgi:hypothetical protein